MARKNSWKNSDGKTCVPAGRDAGFKRCCLRTGNYDGGKRNYFFPGVERAKDKRRNGLTFRFLFAIVRSGRGNGKRAACGSIASEALTSRAPSVENS